MAEAETKTVDTKADAGAEKAYAAAAESVSPKKADESPRPSAKIDAAVADVKAAPKKAPETGRKAAARKVKPAVTAAKKAPATRSASRKIAKPAARRAPTTAKPITAVSKLKDKIMATTTNTTADFTQGLKSAATDAQSRAKAAYDKLQSYSGEMTEFTKGNVEALVESGKILGAGVQDMARGEVEAAKGAFETVTADLKAMAAVKSPTELFKLQGEIARRNFDAAVARASKNAEISMKLVNEAFAPISSRMSVTAERLSNAA